MAPIIPLWLCIVIFAVLWGLKKDHEAKEERRKRQVEELAKEIGKQPIEWREMGPTMDHLAERERGDRN